ncbi:PIN domain-containing protein [Rhodococcus opacus]|uniref:PIN domain-containing protein n=1 Tax=Rhodococcus opacus TaxID=37919 RepID=A0A076F744_RHOOP|nr:PIN domain-containing protein [Rhodococcus opacus]AII11484.1 hypothetical protein EP51_46830 [Rhodococcus opacus]
MIARPIIDAGPALNFLAINKERLLIDAMGPLSTPETVRNEVLRKSRSTKDLRFRAVENVLKKIPVRFLEVLSDDETPELDAAVTRLSRLPLPERKTIAEDLGETMVVAHAVVKAEAGHDVIVIIDDRGGAAMATAEKNRMDRLRSQGRAVGSITLVNTVTILRRAAGRRKYLPDKAAMQEIYSRLRQCDDGLLPIKRTNLLDPDLWK